MTDYTDLIERLREPEGRARTMLAGGDGLRDPIKLEAADEIEKLRAELETERMRLAACGVVAMANTPESAKAARDMHPDYRSASCDDVARMVDENMKLRADAERAEWMASVLFTGTWLTTDAGCGCCGDGMLFPEGTEWRTAADAARGAT